MVVARAQVDESPIDALALYIKALHIYHSISQYAKKNAQSQNLTASKRLGLGLLPPLPIPAPFPRVLHF
jgi:hypothetical protein